MASVKICSKCKIEKDKTSFRLMKEYLNKQKIYVRDRRRNPEQRTRENYAAKLYGQTVKGRSIRLFLAAKRRAKQLNLEFDIALGRIEIALMIGSCERTGIPFDLNSPNKYQFNPFSPSIDKKNSFGGYTNDNTQIVCNAYNLGKGQMTDDEFVQFCRMVVQRHGK